jgi:hypothetical protein
MIAEIILICLFFGSIVFVAAKDGEPRDDYSFTNELIGDIILIVIIYFAGGFDIILNYYGYH